MVKPEETYQEVKPGYRKLLFPVPPISKDLALNLAIFISAKTRFCGPLPSFQSYS